MEPRKNSDHRQSSDSLGSYNKEDLLSGLKIVFLTSPVGGGKQSNWFRRINMTFLSTEDNGTFSTMLPYWMSLIILKYTPLNRKCSPTVVLYFAICRK